MAAFVKVVNDGLYMAKFEVSWEEPAAEGNWVSKSWDSASQPVRYSEQVEMPGNARNVRIQAWAATGLVWEQWAEILDVRLNAPDNKVYRVFGTTLDRGWDNNDIKPLERAPDDGTIGGFRPPMTGWGGML